jgi:hypothetical protein
MNQGGKTGWQRRSVYRYSLAEVAQIFGVTGKTIDNWCAAGKFVQPLKDHAVGNCMRARKFWTAADIDKEKVKRGIK